MITTLCVLCLYSKWKGKLRLLAAQWQRISVLLTKLLLVEALTTNERPRIAPAKAR